VSESKSYKSNQFIGIQNLAPFLGLKTEKDSRKMTTMIGKELLLRRSPYRPSLVLLAFLATASLTFAQGTKLPIQQAIEAKYAVTKPTADHKDMIIPGAVIDLLKDDLLMSSADQPAVSSSTYKEGHFEAGGMSKFNSHLAMMSTATASNNRTFLAGEKFWLIAIDVRNDAAVLEFLSDPINDRRYRAFVRYPFPKGVIPAPEQVLQQIGETISAEPMNAGGNQAAPPQPAAAPAPPPAPAAPMADIPPPPAPTDAPAPAPKTISLGESKDDVVASFGAPAKIVQLSTKEIDYYPDMKVIFVKGKVTDVQ
jgi:hypothetical protein